MTNTRTMYLDLLARIRANVVIDDAGCWNWQRRCDRDGYARMNISVRGGSNRTQRTMRVAYALVHERAITGGMVLDHLCSNRRCVNPAHLEEIPPAENTRRGARKRLHTPCPNCGAARNGVRCVPCRRAAWRRYATAARARKRAAQEVAR